MTKIFSSGGFRRLVLASCMAVHAAGWAAYPDKPVTIVVAGAPSGGTDFLARLVAEKLTAQWGESVVVENRAGASGLIGTRHVLKSAPDGYTLIMGHSATHAIVPALYRPKPYDAIEDFRPVSLIATAPEILAVAAGSPVESVADLLARAKAEPKSVTYGSPGVGLPQHLLGFRLGQIAGVQMEHVPYKGSSPALNDLIGGRLSAMVVTSAAVMPFIKDGRVRALAVNSSERMSLLPDVPTFSELGMPQLTQIGWFGLFAPAGTPQQVVDAISQACMKAVALPDVQQKMHALYMDPVGSSASDFAAFQRKEVEKWTQIVQQSGLHID